MSNFVFPSKRWMNDGGPWICPLSVSLECLAVISWIRIWFRKTNSFWPSMMLNCSANSDQRPINKKSPHYFVFTRWMGSWERDFSIWSNPFYSEALLCYVGKIYQQQANVYHFFNQLWQESFRSSFDELDLLHFLIERLSRRPGWKRKANRSFRREIFLRLSGIKTTIKNRQETSRIESRLNELKSILMQDENSRFQIRWKSTKHQNIDLQSIETYLDFGCGNGLISSNLGKFLKLKREQIFVCDVFNSENDDVTFIPINKTTGKIDLGNNFLSNFKFKKTFANRSAFSSPSSDRLRK